MSIADRIRTDAPIAPSLSDALALVQACPSPSEAYWRLLELKAVRQLEEFAAPVLEIGCGNGLFTELAGIRVDYAIDRESNAVARAAERRGTYVQVAQLDAHELTPSLGRFATIFSNSVLEHIPDLPSILVRCQRLLEPGGHLIATVPLRDMNRHMALRRGRYVHSRQQFLAHLNLWSLGEWRSELLSAGFRDVRAMTYLDATTCRRWDTVDALAGLGVGRYRMGAVLHATVNRVLPATQRHELEYRVASRLLSWASQPASGAPCAAVIVAAVT